MTAQRMTLDNAIQDRRHGVKCRYRYCVASGLQATGQGAGHAPFATGSRDSEGDLLILESFDQTRGNLDRATASPGLARQADDDRPGANKVMNPPIDLQRVETSLRRSVEVVRLPQVLSQRRRLAPGELDRLFIRQRQSQRFVAGLLRNYGYRDGPPQAVVKVAHEPVAHTQQLVSSGAGDSYLDSALEAAPEGPKIFVHDSQSSESEDQGYSPAPAL